MVASMKGGVTLGSRVARCLSQRRHLLGVRVHRLRRPLKLLRYLGEIVHRFDLFRRIGGTDSRRLESEHFAEQRLLPPRERSGGCVQDSGEWSAGGVWVWREKGRGFQCARRSIWGDMCWRFFASIFDKQFISRAQVRKYVLALS